MRNLEISNRAVSMTDRKSSGFSLVELLVVISIIVLMASLMGPTLNSALRGNAMTQAGDKVTGTLTLAHQMAVTRNQTIEVRIYSYIDPEMPGDKGQGRAIQAFTVDDAGIPSPISKVQVLPPTVVISTNPTLSTIFSLTSMEPSQGGNFRIPRVGTKYQYVSYKYYRSGSTSLVSQSTSASSQPHWCITLEGIQDASSGKTTLPKNFTTITIDPYNGALKTYRPTL